MAWGFNGFSVTNNASYESSLLPKGFLKRLKRKDSKGIKRNPLDSFRMLFFLFFAPGRLEASHGLSQGLLRVLWHMHCMSSKARWPQLRSSLRRPWAPGCASTRKPAPGPYKEFNDSSLPLPFLGRKSSKSWRLEAHKDPQSFSAAVGALSSALRLFGRCRAPPHELR